MTTSFARRARAAAISLVALAITACGESTTAFDAIALSENTDEIINTMDDSPAMQSMDSLGSKMSAAAPGLGAASLVAATLPGPAPTGSGAGFPAWAAHRLAALQTAVSTPGVTVLATAGPRLDLREMEELSL